MKPFKFIHCADIHLGKQLNLNSNLEENLKIPLNKIVENTFTNMVDLALKEKADFILIAGDLYDLENRSIKASKFFLKQALKLKKEGIKIYIISGNHDPAGEKKEPFSLPDNIKYFSSDKVETENFYQKDELSARILGQSYRQRYEDRSMYNYYTAADSSTFNIALLHTNLTKDSSYVPVTKKDLISKNKIDYWALGHIHQYEKINNKPGIFYSGTIQGRDISETQNKGAILVEVDQFKNYETKFIALSEINYYNLEFDLNEKNYFNKISDLENYLKKEIEDFSKKIIAQNKKRPFKLKAAIFRLIIKGRTKIHDFIKDNKEELEIELSAELNSHFDKHFPQLGIDSIIFRTAPALENIESIKKNNPLFKELDLLVKESLEENDLKEELISEWGKIWQGNQNSEARDNDKFYPEEDFKKEILAEAEKIILSELIEDEN